MLEKRKGEKSEGLEERKEEENEEQFRKGRGKKRGWIKGRGRIMGGWRKGKA